MPEDSLDDSGVDELGLRNFRGTWRVGGTLREYYKTSQIPPLAAEANRNHILNRSHVVKYMTTSIPFESCSARCTT